MTKPTRAQGQACDRLAEALLTLTEAARLDGGHRLDPAGLRDLFARVARLSSAFPPDQVLARALERRAQALKLRTGTAELLMLVGDGEAALDTLLLDDDGFRARVAVAEEELGDV